jgi:hypothetical protein
MFDRFRHAPDIRGNHWKSRPHCFQYADRKQLGLGSQHKNFRISQQGRNITAITHEGDTGGYVKFLRQALGPSSHGPIPNKPKAGAWRKFREGPQQNFMMLWFCKTRYHRNHGRLSAKTGAFVTIVDAIVYP